MHLPYSNILLMLAFIDCHELVGGNIRLITRFYFVIWDDDEVGCILTCQARLICRFEFRHRRLGFEEEVGDGLLVGLPESLCDVGDRKVFRFGCDVIVNSLRRRRHDIFHCRQTSLILYLLDQFLRVLCDHDIAFGLKICLMALLL